MQAGHRAMQAGQDERVVTERDFEQHCMTKVGGAAWHVLERVGHVGRRGSCKVEWGGIRRMGLAVGSWWSVVAPMGRYIPVLHPSMSTMGTLCISLQRLHLASICCMHGMGSMQVYQE